MLGVVDSFGHTLTPVQLRAWARSARPRLICAFCSLTMPATETACAHCDEYQGLQPYIQAHWRRAKR